MSDEKNPSKPYIEIEVSEAASGEDEFSYWVSLGLENSDDPLDTLHIVCGKEADSSPGFQGLYFERSQQGNSEYDLASSISVNEAELAVRFNARGREILGFPGTVRLLPTESAIATWQSACATFKLMAATPNGGVLSFSQC